MEWTITGINELEDSARKLLMQAGERKVMAFSGEIGAGKTSLIQRLCQQLGVEEKVTSPTFALANVYASSSGEEVFHLDLYRLKDTQEALDMGIEEYLYGDRYCFIEWPAVIEELLPADTLYIRIELIENSHRKIVLL
ncbi:MAG: tRNA (adenosine(37)-N6)-threonylcarbamoyltransferase complex ATPase subunit type 1 TsaE [Saprospiraceae bacterium]|nr:tRNA (adenosine(37)-N6)-threonylcarbamoyltransferase complex ATPase subunit type 1 TsaE [Saprospiraceae bacterium]